MRLYGWIGLLLLVASQFCLFLRIEPFTTWFYCFAWWSYILLADNLLLKIRGSSLLTGRRLEFWGMLPISVFIWLIFEAYNFVINNWAYSSVPSQLWLRWTGYAVAFSTVLPGIFITSDLLQSLISRHCAPASEYEPLEAGPGSEWPVLLVVLGSVLTVAPLIWPRYFFAAVWVGPILLLDPILEKAGIKSLSRSVSAGDWSRVRSLLLGGLACGLMWECWNFWAGAKWIYTVPFFDRLKIFEMPVLGFLGFPPFALECWILYHLIRAVPRHMGSAAARLAWWSGLAIISIIIFRGIDEKTVIRFAEKLTRSLNLCGLV